MSTAAIQPISKKKAANILSISTRTVELWVRLGHVVGRTATAPESYYLSEESLAQWRYLKGGKSAERVTAGGFAYTYSEGPVTFPDDLARPSRTVITGEGGSAASRFKHVIATPDG